MLTRLVAKHFFLHLC